MKKLSSKKLCTVCSLIISAIVLLYYTTVRTVAALSDTLDISYTSSGWWWIILLSLPVAHGIFTAGSESNAANLASLLTLIPYITASNINWYLSPLILIYWIVVYALHANRAQKAAAAEDSENAEENQPKEKSTSHVIVKAICLVLIISFTLFLGGTHFLEKVLFPGQNPVSITETDYPSPDGSTKVTLCTEYFNDTSAPEKYRNNYTVTVTTERVPLFSAGPVTFCREATVLYEEESNTEPNVTVSWSDNDTVMINGEEFDLN